MNIKYNDGMQINGMQIWNMHWSIMCVIPIRIFLH